METVDTIIAARWIIPVEPEGEVLEDHCLVVNRGRIVDLLATVDAGARYAPTETVTLPSHALIPGLVNAHTHAAMTLLRGLADDLPLMEWLNEHIWPTEARWVDADFVRDGTTLAVAEMLRGGITCFSDMYFFPEVVAEVVQECGMRACVGMIVIDFPSAWGSGPEEYLDKGLALREAMAGNGLVHMALAPHAPYTISASWLERVRSLAEELDLPIHMHVHETAAEVARWVAEHGRRPLRSLEELGLVTSRLAAVHMTQLADDEVDLIAGAGTSVVHCPESNLKLASGMCETARLMSRGVNLALGTDGAASNNDLNLLGEMRTAALLGKGVAGAASAVPAASVLRMATIGGARAFGLGSRIGSLAAGKWADLTAVDLGALESQPVYNPISQLVYATGRHQVSDVWVAGRRVLADRRLTAIDGDRLAERTVAWRDRIAGG